MSAHVAPTKHSDWTLVDEDLWAYRREPHGPINGPIRLTADDWTVSITFKDDAVIGFGVQSPGHPLTARDVRNLRFGEYEQIARRWALGRLRPFDLQYGDANLKRLETVRAALETQRRPSDLALAALSAAYVEASIGSEHPGKELAERLRVAPDRFYSWLRSADRRGFISDRQRGRSGGVLTQKAADMLTERGLL